MKPTTKTEPDIDRFLADLQELRRIGTFRTGVHRPTYGAEDMESRRWLVAKLEEIGHEAAIDGIGNVLGRHAGRGPRLLAGSHLETQNEAGWLDGALGVVSALHLARCGLPVDVIAFADEEGHYGSFIGSRSFTGLLEESEIDRLANRHHGKMLRAGLADRPRLALEEGRYKGFLEMHIEQGTTLENAGEQIGVVTGIVAIWQYRITIAGQQDHAGGTTMAERKVWTAGRIALTPGAASIIPGRAEILFQFRDIDMDVLSRLDTVLRRAVQ